MTKRLPPIPVCGFVFTDADGVRHQCAKKGKHLCAPRASHARAFFEEILVHTKGVWARKPFILAAWQWKEIIEPAFGRVDWSREFECYTRITRIIWIELARKQGKSEILAGIALYLLCADGEESAEIYGAAEDRDQARKVFDVAKRMVELSPLLSRRLTVHNAAKRIVDERTGSYYECIASDAAGNLGHNPHGIVFDEVLTQKNGDLWDALRTAMGTRAQPLMVAATTPGNNPQSWCGDQHNEYQRIADNPARAPHVLVCLHNTPMDADPWDERNWKHANPALGDFLSLKALRDEAQEAKNDPAKENAFRQFRLAQWVKQATRWMPMHLYDAAPGDLWLTPDYHLEQFTGRRAYGGFDLAARFDLTSWCWAFPRDGDDEGVDLMWRFWMPESVMDPLDKANNGRFTRWAQEGWVTVTEGDVLDYERIYADIEADAARFDVRAIDGDMWSSYPVIQEIGKRTSLEVDDAIVVYNQTFQRMTPGMVSLMAAVKQHRLHHHGNPVAWWCFDNVEVRRAPYDPELIRPDKPARDKSGKRIDGVPAAAMALNAMLAREVKEKPVPGIRIIGAAG